jgi:hypothetical protein
VQGVRQIRARSRYDAMHGASILESGGDGALWRVVDNGTVVQLREVALGVYHVPCP